MPRTILVSIAGLILSGILAATFMAFMLTHTQFGALMTGNSAGIADQWQVFMSGSRVLFFYVSLPTVIAVALFVGLLARKAALFATVFAVLPISVIASGPALHNAWISLVLVGGGLFVATASQRVVRR